MHQIIAYQSIVEEKIQSLRFPDFPKKLYDPLRYFLKLGGKRTRPSLTLLSCSLFGEPGIKAINAALAIELFHNFTLIHDDIMDEAPLRRGKETIHTKWDRDVAILSGDVLFIEAFSLLTKHDAKLLPGLFAVFNQTAKEVCEGQQLDMDFESSNAVTIESYIEMIRLKTSVLLGAALKMGAVVAGEKDPENIQNIYDFGVNIGLAFQMQDDLLDLYTESDKFGKQVGGDILSNKKTYLLLKAYELANPQEKEELDLQLLNQDGEEKIRTVKVIFDRLNVKAAAEEQKQIFYQKAIVNIQNIKVPDKNKRNLLNLAEQLMSREH